MEIYETSGIEYIDQQQIEISELNKQIAEKSIIKMQGKGGDISPLIFESNSKIDSLVQECLKLLKDENQSLETSEQLLGVVSFHLNMKKNNQQLSDSIDKIGEQNLS